ncbi:MAG: hypothetical protein JWR19_4181 [Pedosphaera sp.]|nr:hypothetical protein [Pedosphaera sp.]
MDWLIARVRAFCDLVPGQGFNKIKHGIRHAISEPIRFPVLEKLLELNRQRYAEEVKACLHEKSTKKGKAPPEADADLLL